MEARAHDFRFLPAMASYRSNAAFLQSTHGGHQSEEPAVLVEPAPVTAPEMPATRGSGASHRAFTAPEVLYQVDPKPFVWTATVESVQEKLNRCRRTLEQIQPS